VRQNQKGSSGLLSLPTGITSIILFPSMHQATDEAYQAASMGMTTVNGAAAPIVEPLHQNGDVSIHMGPSESSASIYQIIKYVIFKSTVPRKKKEMTLNFMLSF
jgi:hypothetical protein